MVPLVRLLSVELKTLGYRVSIKPIIDTTTNSDIAAWIGIEW